MYLDTNDGGTDWNKTCRNRGMGGCHLPRRRGNHYAVQLDKLNQIEMLMEDNAALAAALDAWFDTELFKNNLASFARHVNEPKNPWGKPSVANVTRRDMRLITMDTPFHVGLILARENGQLKISFAATFIPPD